MGTTAHRITVEAIEQARTVIFTALRQVADAEQAEGADYTDERVRLGRVLETLNANDPATVGDQIRGMVPDLTDEEIDAL